MSFDLDAVAVTAAEVRAEMARQCKSQAALAQRLGMSQPAVSRRLMGHVPFDVRELAVVAQFLGKRPSELMDEPVPIPPP